MRKTIKASDARQQLPELLNTVSRGDVRVVVERSGIPVAAIVSSEDLETLARLDRQRAEFATVVGSMRESFTDVPEDEILAETTKAVAEVRAQTQASREGTERAG